MDTKAKRAAALGYGLSFLLVLPPADGTISVNDAGHALNAYQFDIGVENPVASLTFVQESLVSPVEFVESMEAAPIVFEAVQLVSPLQFEDSLVSPASFAESMVPIMAISDEELG